LTYIEFSDTNRKRNHQGVKLVEEKLVKNGEKVKIKKYIKLNEQE